MAKTTYLNIPAGLENFYWDSLQPQDRFLISRVRVKKVFFTPQQLINIKARQWLTACKNIWAGFSANEKLAWKTTDTHPHPHGWREFVADQCKRIKYELPGSVTPNQYHHDMVGEIFLGGDATEIKLLQPHPYKYYVAKKVAGKKSMYSPVEVDEYLTLPFEIGISYKTDLTAVGSNPYAKFYAKIQYHYQGQNLFQNLEIILPLSHIWDRQTATVNTIATSVVDYILYIELNDVQGTILFDNVLAEHSAQNWARDIYCKKIEQSFSRAFYQVPKAWAPEILPDGAGYKSVYPI